MQHDCSQYPEIEVPIEQVKAGDFIHITWKGIGCGHRMIAHDSRMAKGNEPGLAKGMYYIQTIYRDFYQFVPGSTLTVWRKA